MAINFLKLRIASIYRLSHDRFGKFQCNTDIGVAKEPIGVTNKLVKKWMVFEGLTKSFKANVEVKIIYMKCEKRLKKTMKGKKPS
ncbi:hypothetical protein Hanom_Chr17g01538221 [Helianthus anomalus]